MNWIHPKHFYLDSLKWFLGLCMPPLSTRTCSCKFGHRWRKPFPRCPGNPRSKGRLSELRRLYFSSHPPQSDTLRQTSWRDLGFHSWPQHPIDTAIWFLIINATHGRHGMFIPFQPLIEWCFDCVWAVSVGNVKQLWSLPRCAPKMEKGRTWPPNVRPHSLCNWLTG